MQLLQHLVETEQIDQFKYAFAGSTVDYNALSAEQRDAVFAFGAKRMQPQLSQQGGGTGGNSGGGGDTASGFDWSGIIDGLFGTIGTIIETYGGKDNPAPAPGYQPPSNDKEPFDWAPVKTIAIYVGGAIGIGLLIWGVVAIVKASKKTATA
jgi:hypothetical protein